MQRYADNLANILEDEFGEDIEVLARQDPWTSGKFEVTVANKLIHSHYTKGHGRCETEEERQVIIDYIRLYLSIVKARSNPK